MTNGMYVFNFLTWISRNHNLTILRKKLLVSVYFRGAKIL